MIKGQKITYKARVQIGYNTNYIKEVRVLPEDMEIL